MIAEWGRYTENDSEIGLSHAAERVRNYLAMLGHDQVEVEGQYRGGPAEEYGETVFGLHEQQFCALYGLDFSGELPREGIEDATTLSFQQSGWVDVEYMDDQAGARKIVAVPVTLEEKLHILEALSGTVYVFM